MIKLYQFAPAFGLPNPSPFCMKLENYLRMAGLPFETPRADLGAFRRAPKGKMPYIEDNGRLLPDSAFIIDYLKVTYGDKLDAELTAEQKAVSLAFRRLMEENLYWVVLYIRWAEPAGWAHLREAFFGRLPTPMKWVVAPAARRGLLREMYGHGMGRHTRDEIYAVGKQDVSALADFLADKPFFMGDNPTSLDATAYAFLANLLWVPVESELKQHAQQYPQLGAYCRRMQVRYYS